MSRVSAAYDRMKGPVVPLNICFNEDGTVDYGAVSAYVSWLAAQQVPILLLTYGSSEFAALSDEEVYRLTEVVAAANEGRSMFIASTKYWKPSETRKFLAHADAAGADAVKVQVDGYNQTAAALPRYFDQIEGVNDMPLLLWTISQPMLPVETAVELSRRPGIIGMKNDADMFAGYYDYTRGSAGNQFGVISGGQMRKLRLRLQVRLPRLPLSDRPLPARGGAAVPSAAWPAATTTGPGRSCSGTRSRSSTGR